MTSLDVVALFEARVGQLDDESVTQLEHALQCAALARRHRADDELVRGALPIEARLALETGSWFVDAVRIRRWDDEAKVPGAVVPPLDEYRQLLERWLGPQSPCGSGLARA